MHSFSVRLEPFEIHCWYALVLDRPATIEFPISLSLQSPTHEKLYKSTILLTSCMYDESVLVPWFNALRWVKAAISSDFGLVHSSRLSRIVLRLSRSSLSSVFKYVLASFPAHRVTNFIFVSAFLMCDSTVSMRSSTSSLQSLYL